MRKTDRSKAVNLLTLCEATLSKAEIKAIQMMGQGFEKQQKRKQSPEYKKTVQEWEKLRTKLKVEVIHPEWTKLEGQSILQVPGEKIAAVPATGKKSSRQFIVFNVDTREELTSLKKSEVFNWLTNRAINRKRDLIKDKG